MPNIKKAQSFWMWFMCHEKVYLNLENVNEEEKEAWLDELLDQLHKYNKELGCVLNLMNGIHAELIITAEGNFKLFEDVLFLVNTSPVLEDWDFINFIYPNDVSGAFIYEDVILFQDDIYFKARKNNKRLGLLDLQLFIKDFKYISQSKHINDAINMFLLSLLGEIDFATAIGKLTVKDMLVASGKKRLLKLHKLPEFVSKHSMIRCLFPAMKGFIF
ncbi:hypothetical protein [Chitinophaga sp. S165]|uniref:hypothetical protein n=1 Tax=Chitinophaga sp. S165 TaxID=2135462 RepID=UPI000D71C7CB|nr:hypothetical protein [Chitinophaga sp. S165]PWV47021.1 hypothetical protein C7475_109108 [Chitinophaga sp. S165]